MKHILTAIVICGMMGLLLYVWCKGKDILGYDDRPISNPRLIFWPPRLSNYLVLLAAAIYVFGCIRFPPVGSLDTIAPFVLLFLLGSLLRRWEA